MSTTISYLTNLYRSERGLNTLGYSQGLTTSAKTRAIEICTSGAWSHTRPDGSQWHTAITPRYTYVTAGENLAKGYTTHEQEMDGWHNSPTHRANLVGSWQDIGTYTHDCNGVNISVQHFGTPKAAPAPKPVPKPPTPQQVAQPAVPVPVEEVAEKPIEEAVPKAIEAQPTQSVDRNDGNNLWITPTLCVIIIVVIGFVMYNVVKKHRRTRG